MDPSTEDPDTSMPQGSILLVEDDPRLAELVQEFLSQEGHRVVWVKTGEDALARSAEETFSLVVLDIMLPGIDGLEVCRRLRPTFNGAILMLTARGDVVDEFVGLVVGADDYLAKPVRPRLLLAHITALLRRSASRPPPSAPRSRLTFAEGLVVDLSRREVVLDGDVVELTTAEFDLLLLLAESAGTPVDRDVLYRELRGIDYDGLDRTIDIRVSKLRRKLDDPADRPRLIKGVRGVGYLLAVTPVEPA